MSYTFEPGCLPLINGAMLSSHLTLDDKRIRWAATLIREAALHLDQVKDAGALADINRIDGIGYIDRFTAEALDKITFSESGR